MLHDSQDGSSWTMTAQAFLTPAAMPAREVDLSYNPFADPPLVVSLYDFAYEFVARRSGKSVVSALEFQIRVANPAEKQTDKRETLRPSRCSGRMNSDTSVLNLNGDH